MEYEKCKGKYIPKFESEEKLQAAVLTKAIADYSTCSLCRCAGIPCDFCILGSKDACISYLKQHREWLENYLKDLSKTSKEKG